MISALMLTTPDRWWFQLLAAETWLLNNRARTDELVIVCEEAIDLGFTHPQVRVVKIDPQPDLASKRNLGVRACAQPWVAFWDDDDWHGTDRILRLHMALTYDKQLPQIFGQTSYLVHELTGMRRLFRWTHGQGWPGPTPPEPYVVGGTMMFQRQLALEKPFVEQVTRGDEGWWTVERLREGVPWQGLPEADYVAMIHGANTCAKTPRVDEHGFVMSDHQMTLLGDVSLFKTQPWCNILPMPILARYVTAAFAQSDPHRE